MKNQKYNNKTKNEKSSPEQLLIDFKNHVHDEVIFELDEVLQLSFRGKTTNERVFSHYGWSG